MSRNSFDPNPLRRNFYGRRHGKTLRRSQKSYLADDLGSLRPRNITLSENPARTPIELKSIFGDDRPIWLEIGFGGGEHMIHIAQSYPEIGIVGCEPFINGVAMLVGKIRAAAVRNISVHPGDVRDLMDVMPDGSIAKAFLNYPDPWPKMRHHRRRFVTPEHLLPLHRIMASGAEFRVVTDIPSYVRQTLTEVPQAGFELESLRAEAWPDWLSTRYEQKALRAQRTPTYISFRRV